MTGPPIRGVWPCYSHELVNPNLIAGIGLTRLRGYEQRPAPDGVQSGCAHVHACTDEGYYVVSGTGAIELHDAAQGFRSVPLAPGHYVQFPPDTLHRSVSTGALEVLAIMGNAGLAEHGDARIYFGAEIDAQPEEFARLVGLTKTNGLAGALERRDASVRAYMQLLALWANDREAYFAELARFIECHHRAIANRHAEFESIVREGSGRWVERGLERIGGTVRAEAPLKAAPAQAEQLLGMCGMLEPVQMTSDA